MKAVSQRLVLGTFLFLAWSRLEAQASDTPSLLGDTAQILRLPDGSLLMNDRLPPTDALRIASSYSYHHFGVFCKAEAKMNAWFPIPVMIRMGDVQKAEELDGKSPFRLPR